MPKQYEAPELTLIGQADEVVLGACCGASECMTESAPDFEFEQD